MKHRQNIRRLILAAVLFIVMLTSLALPATAFPDTVDHWAGQEISLLSAKGLIGGYPDGTFRPDQGITRAEFARLLISALNMEDSAWALETSGQLFRDVPLGHWARVYIQLAWELGVVSGYKDGTFRPDQVINRAEMVSMLLRALKYVGHGDREVSFTDELPDWAQESIHLAAQWGLVSGYEDGTFRAHAPVTRAQAAVFLSRMLAQRGTLYEIYGSILSVSENTISLALDGQVTKLPLREGCLFYAGGQPVAKHQLAFPAPQPALLAVHREGKVAFVQLLEKPLESHIAVAYQSAGAAAGTRDVFGISFMDQRLEGEDEPALPVTDPAESLTATKKAMNLAGLLRDAQVDGRGQVIAIIDSGVDPGHPDLRETTNGRTKIIGWRNFTDEGKVELSFTVPASGSVLSHQGVSYRLPGVASKSGVLRFGFLEEESQGVDFNLDGDLTDRFLVVAVDSRTAGVYDRVFLDTEGDRDLSNETPLEPYDSSRTYATFKGPFGNSFNLVVSHLDPAGTAVVFGYDQLGHGTQVAGIAAANGVLQGVAPGARLLVAKVLDREGTTQWEQLAEAIRWAAAEGADVINLSLGYYRDETSGNNTLTKLVDDLSEQGIIFTIAAGNEGPGLGTLATPGNAKSAISVGAYITPEMWRIDYGYEVANPTLWYFSSAGPRQDGFMVPTVVAPGSAVSTWPLTAGTGYRRGEGTSIAAPHVAGAVALMRQAAEERGFAFDWRDLKQALASASQSLPGMTAAEVGYGAFDAGRTWRELRYQEASYKLFRGYAYNRRLGFGEGLFSREVMPGDVPYYVINQGDREEIIFWSATAEWLKPLFQMTSLPAGGRRELPVEYVLPQDPGLYTGWLEGRLLTSTGADIRLLTTVIKPYLLHRENMYRQELSGSLPAGQYKRYFFKVPPGTSAMQLSLSVTSSQGKYDGRVRLHVNQPNGAPYGMTDWVGLAPQGQSQKGWAGLVIEQPQAGIWEVVVYSSASLSTYGRRDSHYRLSVQLAGVDESSAPSRPLPYFVSVTPKELVPGKLNYVTVHVFDRDTLKPFTGMLVINEQLYQVKRGQVTLTVVPRDEDFVLNIQL